MKLSIVQICMIMLALLAGFNAANAESLKMTDDVGQVATTESLINLNTASLEQLMALPGIGKSKAAAIISYRESELLADTIWLKSVLLHGCGIHFPAPRLHLRQNGFPQQPL